MIKKVQIQDFMARHYRRCLEQPVLIIVMIVGLCGFAAYYAQRFTFDASSDTLIAEHDPELAYYRKMVRHFGESSFLVLTYTPLRGKLIVASQLENLKRLESRLLTVPGVKDVSSILDAPLLQSPPIALAGMNKNFNTLRKHSTNLAMAEKELTTSPLFKNLLISADGQTTILRVELSENSALNATRAQRDQLLLHPAHNAQALQRLNEKYRQLKESFKKERAREIGQIRAIRDGMSSEAQIFLGGVPMVTVDMIDFVEQDMRTFGLGILVLVVLALYVFFRRLRWVLIPLGTMGVTILLLIGLLGFLNHPATAISANFVALIAIITISFTVHLIVRYMELRQQNLFEDHTDLVYETMKSKFAPSMYTGLTTAVAFASLLTSDIVPVIDFGWIMCIGIAISFVVTYSFFASVLVLLPKGNASSTLGKNPLLTRWLGELSIGYSNWILAAAVASALIAGFGISKLNLDNRFTEYFKRGSEIRDGMEFIDREMGGTIPLDVILKFPPYQALETDQTDEDDFANFDDPKEDTYPEKYWFTPKKIALVSKMQAYLDSRPELGKSVSLANLEQIAQGFNDDKPLDYLRLVSVLSLVPETVKKNLIDPYASPHTGEMRIASRVHETGPTFSRSRLIRNIKNYAVNTLGFQQQNVHVTGMTVLFSSMLNQLLKSQTSTLVFVLLATFGMFVLLLRSIKLAIIGLIPNVLAATTILAFMGYVGIPLDLMTISIAAIVVGIGVDDAIHYLHRFTEQTHLGDGTTTAIRNSHATIGSALYYTSVTIVAGFSLLSFSNFVPTVDFGLLTALAMILALAANLAVLPSLLVIAYPEQDILG